MATDKKPPAAPASRPPAAKRPRAPRNPYQNAILMMRKAEARADVASRLIRVTMMLAVISVVMAAMNGYLAWQVTHPPVKYFSTEDGRVIPLVPLDQPGWTQNDAVAFGSRTLMEALNLDFVHYRAQLSGVAPRFSADGYSSFIRALESSNVLSTVRNNRMNLTASTGAGVVVKSGHLQDGTFIWVIQYPVRLRLIGQDSARPELAFTFEITIQRTDPRLKPAGMEIRQLVSRNAPRT